jgi:hypothetical protein
MAYEHRAARYRNWYAKLLRFYPKPYRERFGEGMEQTFNDLYRERKEAGEGLFGFVLWVFVETSAGIIKENLNHNHMKNLSTKPTLAATIGFLFAAPFVIMNFIIALRIEPFFSFIGSFPAIRNATLTPLLLLLLFPIGAYIAALPMLRQDASGKRKMIIANSIVIAILLVVFAVLFTALGEEFYRCDILNIPKCD